MPLPYWFDFVADIRDKLYIFYAFSKYGVTELMFIFGLMPNI